MEAGEKALERMAEFHRNQREVARQRQEKRNKEVDTLISQLGDPRVAEKLRIYRLVEEQFSIVEAQVEKEVQEELEVKRRNKKAKQEKQQQPKLPDLKGAAKLLHKARTLRGELQSEMDDPRPPQPIKDHLAKKQALQKAGLKEIKKQVPKLETFPAKPIKSIPVKKVVPRKVLPKKPQAKQSSDDDETDDGIMLFSKPIIRDLTSKERMKMNLGTRSNVGYVTFQHVDNSSEDEVKVKRLSGHILGGVDISPAPSDISPVPCLKPVITENVDQPRVTSENVPHEEPLTKVQDVSEKSQDEKKETVTEKDNGLANVAKEILDQIEERGKQPNEWIDSRVDEDDYSSTFEEDVEEEEDSFKNFLPDMPIPSMSPHDDSIGTFTDRLSTIPEDPSQMTNPSSEHSSSSEDKLETGKKTKTKIEANIQAHLLSVSQGPLSPSPSHSSPDPIQHLSLSEGPLQPSDDNSSIVVVAPVQIKSDLSLSEGPLLHSDDTELKTPPRAEDSPTKPQELVKPLSDLDISAIEPTKLTASSSYSSTTQSSSSNTVSSYKEDSSIQAVTTDPDLSDGQVVLGTLLSEGEVSLEGHNNKEKRLKSTTQEYAADLSSEAEGDHRNKDDSMSTFYTLTEDHTETKKDLPSPSEGEM